MNKMKFELGQCVGIQGSAEEGEIVGRAQYLHHENGYLLQYQAADGRAVDGWFGESRLTDAI